MSLIQLTLPGASVVLNSLCRGPLAKAQLRTDLLDIRLPHGIGIDVGWYPQFDPSGSYIVRAYRGSLQSVIEQVETKDIDEVIAEVRRLASRLLIAEPLPTT